MKNLHNSGNAAGSGAGVPTTDAQPHPPTTPNLATSNARPRRPTQQSAVKRPAAAPTQGSPSPSSSNGSRTSAATVRTSAAAPAAPQARSRSPVFWGATEDAALYSGPLGEAVGHVPQGSVLLEASRYRDAFGGWWISTRCDDGSLGWVAYSDGSDRNDNGEASAGSPWQRVYDTRATPALAVENATSGNRRAAAAAASPALPPTAFGANLPDTSVGHGARSPRIDVATIDRCEQTHFIFQDALLFQHYWECVFREDAHRDWNGEYQRALEAYRVMPQLSTSAEHDPEVTAAAREVLSTLLQDFRQAVETAVLQVCAEAVVPLAQRRVAAHAQHPNEVFYTHGILLKRCVDCAEGFLGGDEQAEKLGNVLYRTAELVALQASGHLLYTPLQARCCFGGHSFLCSTIPPYGTENLIFANACPASTLRTNAKRLNEGPIMAAVEDTSTSHNDSSGVSQAKEAPAAKQDDAHHTTPLTPPLVQELLQSLGHTLHLRDGVVPWEWRVYAGRDRRLYLSHTARLLPPVLPLAKERGGGTSENASSSPSSAPEAALSTGTASTNTAAAMVLYPRLIRAHVRPELFYSWPSEWDVNECISAAATRGVVEQKQRQPDAASFVSSSTAAGQWIRGDGITRVAGVLGFHMPLSGLQMPVKTCNSCGNAMDADEIRFVVCANPSECCHICIQCYTRLIMPCGDEAGDKAENDEPLSRTCGAAVQCGGECRKAGCFLMQPPVTAIFHAHGLNLRYLPYVLHRLPVTTRPAVDHLLHVELVARAAKYVVQQDLCRTTTALEARAVCEAALSALLQPTGAASERFWRTRLGPALQRRFDGICEPFQVSVHALRAVAERTQALTGVWLSNTSLTSLNFLSATAARVGDDGVDRPFVEIASISPRTWVFPVPSPPAHSVQESENKKGGGAPAVPLRRRLEAMLLFWIGHTPDDADDLQQPFYLDEAMFQNVQ